MNRFALLAWLVTCSFASAQDFGRGRFVKQPSSTSTTGPTAPFDAGFTLGTNPHVDGCVTLDGGGSNWTQLCPNGVTPLNTASPVQTGAIVSAAGISATSFTGTTTAGPNYFVTNTTAAVAGATLAAAAVITAAALDSVDCVFGVGNEVGTLSWCVTYGGNMKQISGDITTGSSSDVVSGRAVTAGATTGDAVTAASGGYVRADKTFAGTPTAGDCDSAGEKGRISIDTTGQRFCWCEGAAGWRCAASVAP